MRERGRKGDRRTDRDRNREVGGETVTRFQDSSSTLGHLRTRMRTYIVFLDATERERETETERQTATETDRQRQRQTDSDRDRQTERQRQTETDRDRQTER